MKRLSLPLFLLLCLNMLQAQQLEGIDHLRMASRANVVSYDDENDIEHLRYDHSPYILQLDQDWQRSIVDGSPVLTQDYDFPKEWKSYRIFFRMQAAPGYGLFIGEQLIGVSHNSGVVTEFDISQQVRLGRISQLSVRKVGEDDGSLLESRPAGNTLPEVKSCALLLKPLQNIQDYTILAEYDAQTSQGTYTIEADLYNYRKKGKCYYEVEIWDARGHKVDKIGKWCFFDKRSENTQTISSTIPNVLPWNAELPRLYTAVIRLYDDKMQLQDIVGTRFGFRSLGQRNTLVVNDKRITLKGVTLHVGPLDTPQQLKALRNTMAQMKVNNINAIRTVASSPAPEKFYELCDELGFYVVCDANLFPASAMGHAVAADNEYSDLFSNRMRDLYGQFKNHPSIIAWSLGDSPDNGVCMQAAYHTLKQLDSRRPILYAGAQYSDNTDLITPLNATTDLLSQYLSKNHERALVMGSFGSALGNNFGGIQLLWQRVLDHAQVQGGFFNLLDWNEISTKPYLLELKQLYRPIDVQMVSTSPDAAEFVITNLSDFRPLADYRLEYVICSNLKPNVVSGDVAMALKPGESKEFKLKVPKLLLYAGEELFIRFTLRQRGNTSAVPKNTVLSVQQFALPSVNMPRQEYVNTSGTPFQIEKDSVHQIKISNNNFSLIFNDSTGLITSLNYRATELLQQSPRLNFMRAPSPNDLSDPNGVKQWSRYELGKMHAEVVATNCRQVDPFTVGLDVMFRYSSDRYGVLFDVRQAYLILSSGDVLINNDITVSDQIKSVARVGMQMGLSPSLTTAEWLGLNTESYIDRQAAALVAQQSLPIGELSYDYHPAEHGGNYAQTRWAAFRNEQVGLYIDIIDTLFNFSIANYDDELLLQRAQGVQSAPLDYWNLHVDYRMTGVGSASAGLCLTERDLVKDHKYLFTVHLRPFDCTEYNAQDFSRIVYPKVVSNIVELPVISKSRDRFDGPMQIAISCPTPKSQIRYTLDGTVPTEQSQLYTKPFTVQSSVVVKARAYKQGEAPSFVATQQFSFDYVTSCTFAHNPNTPYNKNASRALIDDELGDVNDLSRGWLGFSGHDVQVDLQLGKAVDIHSVTLRFAHVPDAWVFAPSQVMVAVSADGKEYTDYMPATITYDATQEAMNTSQLLSLTIPVNRSQVRFVRLLAKPIAHIPQWHRAKGLKPWVMMDEIEIHETIVK